ASYWRDRRGASATMFAVALPVLIGLGALGAETGAWYTIKRQNQAAADAAVISAAHQVAAGKTNISTDLTPAASEAAAQNRYSGSTPVVVYPYRDAIVDAIVSNSNAIVGVVAVTLSQTQSSMLATLFLPSVTIATKAVAVVKVLD